MSAAAFVSEAWAAIHGGDVPGALRLLAEAYGLIGRWSEGGQRLPIGWPEGDRIIAAAAQIVRGAADPGPDDGGGAGGDAVLFSRWTYYGGHRFAATDILRLSPARQKCAFVVNPGALDPSPHDMAERLGIPADCVEVAPDDVRRTPWEWLPARLRARGCSRLFVVHDTYKPGVLVAALASALARVYILHHIDAKPCSGLHLPGVRVVELTPFCYHYSRINLGIVPIYLPLVSEPPAGGRPPFLATGELRTATCGRESKFALHQGFPYAGIIAERLRRFGGRHVHIGRLSENALARVTEALRRAGVDPGRFEYLSRVPNLPAALWANRVDLYLASFPAGGARTVIDVMASATPAVVHWAGGHEGVHRINLRAPGTAEWSTPEELWKILAAADAAWLEGRSRMAGEHFDRHHRPDVLARALSEPEIAGVEPPALPEGAMVPSPHDVLCQVLADIAWLRRSEGAMATRLAHLEKEMSRALRWPRWPTRESTPPGP
ncbi:MAG: hypothetical protein IT577_21230 [Verrucomicrobiae bacterium]|nr:hypothetical protein [Verrucomicrobiae bacterium]